MEGQGFFKGAALQLVVAVLTIILIALVGLIVDDQIGHKQVSVFGLSIVSIEVTDIKNGKTFTINITETIANFVESVKCLTDINLSATINKDEPLYNVKYLSDKKRSC